MAKKPKNPKSKSLQGESVKAEKSSILSGMFMSNENSLTGSRNSSLTSLSKNKLPRLIRNLDAVFHPKSVAVVGASREPQKIGNVILRNFLEGGFDGPIYAVNPNAPEVLGVPTIKKASDAPGKVDCALVAVPAPFVEEALADSISAGARAAVVITGGFSEIGNKEGEERIGKLALDSDLAMIGPNCILCYKLRNRYSHVLEPVHHIPRLTAH